MSEKPFTKEPETDLPFQMSHDVVLVMLGDLERFEQDWEMF